MDLKKEITIIKAYLDIDENYGDIESISYQALKIKYEALTKVPTTIEKTMTPAQLYASDNPLWTYNYTTEEISNILEVLENKPKTEENFNIALDLINNRTTMFDEYGNLSKTHQKYLQIGMSQKHKLQKIEQ